MEQSKPTVLSKLSLFLFGKTTVMSLLDTAQMIKYQSSRNNIEQLRRLTQYAYAAWNGSLWTSVFSTIFIYYNYFKGQKWHSFKFLRVSVPLVLSIFYIATQLFSHLSKSEINARKKKYLQIYQPNFMQHLKVLKQKYDIDENLQFEGVFNDEQLSQWIDGFLKKHAKTEI